ncbi:MAG: type III restriction-modification system, res subunit [Candidatus Synechococcus spongiarum 15L]|uniref:Type III restriction endonuclease subunit R n=2 Tax=Candidatus Synechococcus spongiarum TaxID=431041 RepID=A0A1T1D3X7_9SYNE|nr:MAG: type III restriction-modification system, res subunit [Candidatus Synechococcus spongiarum 15L]OOV35458.1 type III restriction endonuclease subunit R [Candidatus Synechococcus spongiarum LMB bulk15M]
MSLIINSPYLCPAQHWWSEDAGGSLSIRPGRRHASTEIFDPRNNTRRREPLELVNRIRDRVNQWREAGYPGVTIVTRKLLEHWHDRDARQYPFYFCQLEAVETLVWWIEGTENYKQGIEIPGDGGPWERLCNKMATGAGKTTVMAMIITWQVLNALTYPQRNQDFSRAILVVAPGLTVKERLHVLLTSENSYYDQFNLCPSEALRQKLNQAEVLIENWHTLMPLKEVDRSVVKKGRESDEAFTRRVLGKLSRHKNIVVINDEAHHAYRQPPEVKISKKQAAEQGIDLDAATRWIEGLDRLHNTRRIQRCFDLSATPFAPTGKRSKDAALFNWIVSDFGLNDAIEAGLVKTPRVVVRDDALPDAETLRPKLYHLYRDSAVSQDINRKAQPHEALPKLMQDAYTLLGADWRETRRQWREAGHSSPPIMLTVCNRTETAARIEYHFNQGNAHWPELHAPLQTLRVDSKVLEKAEIGETASPGRSNDYERRLKDIIQATDLPATRKRQLLGMKKEELLREIVDNVGKRGAAGQDLQNVISVAMLSEGWDAKNVTHIMGLRAFTSQLLCEQVIGRGLRRVSYDRDEAGRFLPEYVNVFGVPLSISEPGEGGEAPPPPKPTTQIEVVPDRAHLEIRWPNVLRIEAVVRPRLVVDWDTVTPLPDLDPATTPIIAELAPALGGATHMDQVTTIDLETLPDGFRLQRIVFRAASKVLAELGRRFSGETTYLAAQLVRIIETFLNSRFVQIPSLFHSDPLRQRILIALNIDTVVQHILQFVREQNTEQLTPVFDQENPIGATGQMRTWYTTKPCFPTIRSHISHLVGDSSWEGYAANIFDTSNHVIAYAKNDHLGFAVYYMWNGSRRRYVPDFIMKLSNETFLALEIKGSDSPQNRAKRDALDEWVRAINASGGFGHWAWAVVFEPGYLQDIIINYSQPLV